MKKGEQTRAQIRGIEIFQASIETKPSSMNNFKASHTHTHTYTEKKTHTHANIHTHTHTHEHVNN